MRHAGLLPFAALAIASSLACPVARADQALADLVERVGPSVVNLHTSGVRQPRDYWDAVFGGGGRWESLGSGFVVDAGRQLVITNQHVVGHATEILVMDHQGRIFEADVVGSDPEIDLALLRVPGLDLPAVTLGTSRKLRVGEDVFAVGNPYGHGHTVTRGILSARSRTLGRDAFDLFLQTDAAINPGSSGGPVFDSQGRVVGVATAIDGRGEAIGFAMPVELVMGALPVLSRGEQVQPGWPGLRLGEVRGGSLEVAAVYADGPAEKADLQVGDRVLSVDGVTVRGRAAWLESFGIAFPGDERTLLLSRGGKEVVRKIVLESREAWATRLAGSPLQIEGMYVSVRAVAPDVADRLGIKGGVQVVQASRGSIFQPGDVVLEIDGKATVDPRTMALLCDAAAQQRSLSAVVWREGGAVRISRRW